MNEIFVMVITSVVAFFSLFFFLKLINLYEQKVKLEYNRFNAEMSNKGLENLERIYAIGIQTYEDLIEPFIRRIKND